MKKTLLILATFMLLVSCQTNHRKPSSEDEVLQFSTLPIGSEIVFDKSYLFPLNENRTIIRYFPDGKVAQDPIAHRRYKPVAFAGVRCTFQLIGKTPDKATRYQFKEGSKFQIAEVNILPASDQSYSADPNDYFAEYVFTDSSLPKQQKFTMVCKQESYKEDGNRTWSGTDVPTLERLRPAFRAMGIGLTIGGGASVVNVPIGIKIEPIKYQAPQQNPSATPVEI